MVWVLSGRKLGPCCLSFLFSTDLQYFWILAVHILLGLSFGLSFLILWGWGWFPHRQPWVSRVHLGATLESPETPFAKTPFFLVPELFETLLYGCSFFAYSWKLPAYSGAFLLTIDNSSFFTCSWSFFHLQFEFFTYSWSFSAYSGKVRLISAFRDCKQRNSTVSKKAPTVSEKASPPFVRGLAGKIHSNGPAQMIVSNSRTYSGRPGSAWNSCQTIRFLRLR